MCQDGSSIESSSHVSSSRVTQYPDYIPYENVGQYYTEPSRFGEDRYETHTADWLAGSQNSFSSPATGDREYVVLRSEILLRAKLRLLKAMEIWAHSHSGSSQIEMRFAQFLSAAKGKGKELLPSQYSVEDEYGEIMQQELDTNETLDYILLQEEIRGELGTVVHPQYSRQLQSNEGPSWVVPRLDKYERLCRILRAQLDEEVVQRVRDAYEDMLLRARHQE